MLATVYIDFHCFIMVIQPLKYLDIYYINLESRGGSTSAGCQVPSEAALSLPSSAEQGRENTMKDSWVEIRTGRYHSSITTTGKTDSTWGSINIIYCQSSKNRLMRTKN